MRLLLAVLVLLAFPATAGAWAIQTPSKNIMCGDLPGGKIQCLVKKASWVKRSGCRDTTAMGYGDLSRRGRAKTGRICVGGLTFDPAGMRTLGYGKRSTRNGITCTSRQSGLTCRNRSKHGFVLSRSRVRRF